MITKLLITALAVLVAAPVAQTAATEPAHPVKPLLWKIEGDDLEQPSYLFGTVHLGGGALDRLHPAAEAAFDKAGVVLTEIPFDASTQIAMTRKLIRDDGQTLSQSIGPELRKKLNAELRAIHPELDAAPLDTLRTWAVAFTVPLLEIQLAGHTSVDETIWNRATAAGKTTGGLETADFIGEPSIITHLAEAGYRITRVEE